MASPHDSLFRDTFGKPEHAAPLLRALVRPEIAKAIDWSSLQPAPTPQNDAALHSQQHDLLFTMRCNGRPGLLYVLFEHKSRPDRWTVLQVCGYVIGLWLGMRRSRPPPGGCPRSSRSSCRSVAAAGARPPNSRR
jgi:predicted transposase YdaD